MRFGVIGKAWTLSVVREKLLLCLETAFRHQTQVLLPLVKTRRTAFSNNCCVNRCRFIKIASRETEVSPLFRYMSKFDCRLLWEAGRSEVQPTADPLIRPPNPYIYPMKALIGDGHRCTHCTLHHCRSCLRGAEIPDGDGRETVQRTSIPRRYSPPR